VVTAEARNTIDEVAKLVGRSRQTLHQYQRDGVDVHDVDAVRAHMAKLRPPPGRPSGDSDDLREQKLTAEIARLNEQVRAKELENRVREGELVPRDAVQRWLQSFVTEVRQTIESFTPTVVAEIPGDQRLVVNDVLSEQVRLLLLKLAAMPEELWGDESVKE
jgi:phage terminase Nu1 subunit (DNA packaging protein)